MGHEQPHKSLISLRIEALLTPAEYLFLAQYGSQRGLLEMSPERAYKALALRAIHERMTSAEKESP